MKERGFLKRKGFTLIELMIVVTIIGILLVILLPRVTLMMDRAREKTLYKNLKNIKVALDSTCENADGGYDYPTTAGDFKNNLETKFGTGSVPRAVLRNGSTAPPSNECYVTNNVANIPVGPPPEGGGWVLITEGEDRGRVYINSKDLDTNGISYTTYECW